MQEKLLIIIHLLTNPESINVVRDLKNHQVNIRLLVKSCAGHIVDKENPRAQKLYVHKGYEVEKSMTIGDRTYDHMIKHI